jgi:DNA-binding transcriptional LysR family regulator
MQSQGVDWDDLRTMLALARSGALAGAAGRLGVNASTVFRRLGRIETRLGVRLFDRLPSGYRATEAGARLLAAAERMEEEALALDRSILGRDLSLSGTLRITSSETLACGVLTSYLAAFRARHPGIALELVVENRFLSLSKREADVALRPSRPREGDLFGRRLSAIAWTVYGAPAYFARHGRPLSVDRLDEHELVGWDDTRVHGEVTALATRLAPRAAIPYRTNSLLNQLHAAEAGIGLAILPCFLGDRAVGLERVTPPLAELARELWVVTHEDLRRTARIKAFLEFLGDAVRADRELLEGRVGGSS